MHIAKFYDDIDNLKSDMEYFAEANPISELYYKHGWSYFKLPNNDAIWFFAVKNLEDAMKIAGLVFQWVEFDKDSYFDKEVVNYIKSRIRFPTKEAN